MRIRDLSALAGTFILTLTCALGPALAAASGVPPEYFGSYAGLERQPILDGASYEESLTGLSIDERGIMLSAHRDQRGREWKIHYPTEWILVPHERCLVIKRDSRTNGSNLMRMAFALCFDDIPPGGLRGVRMVTAEGLPLAQYYQGDLISGPVLWQLRDHYDEVRERARQERIRPPDAEQLLSILRGWDEKAKIQLFGQLREYIGDLPESEVPRYFDVITYGLHDRNNLVQIAAVKVLGKVAVFTNAVEPLLDLIARETVHEEVLSRATHALAGLVYEANQLFDRRETFLRAYNTIDMDEIFARTNGIIEANDAPSTLLDIFKLHPPPSRAWTLELREQLLRGLHKLASAGPSPEARREAANITDVLGRKTPSPNCTPQLQ